MRTLTFHSMLRLVALLCVAALASGCSTVEGPRSKLDPFESYNRSIYKFNDKLDKGILKPTAQVYEKTLPNTIKKGIKNFFNNLGDLPVIVNDLLQLKGQQAAYDTSRFIFNSTLGLGGFLDIATDIGLEKHNEDFGQTLGKWGVPTGPYFVLPVLGPSTFRDTVGRVADSPFKGIGYVTPNAAKYGLYGLDAVATRHSLLGASNMLGEAALDPYIFLRDAYLQRRLKQVYDNKVPQEILDQMEEDDAVLDKPASNKPAEVQKKTEETKPPAESDKAPAPEEKPAETK